MKKKVLVVSVLLGILLISIVSAGLLDYFGRITGSVEVSGPVFYLDSTLDSEHQEYYTLKLNDNNVNHTYFTLNGEEKWFVSPELGIDDFYDEKYLINVRVKKWEGEENLTGSIIFELWIGDEDDAIEKICETPILIGIGSNEITTEIYCIPDGTKGLKNIESDEKLMLSIRSFPNGISNRFYTLNSKFQIEER